MVETKGAVVVIGTSTGISAARALRLDQSKFLAYAQMHKRCMRKPRHSGRRFFLM
ncbi:hypothetical protein [Chroococcidiopsis sp. TS-821]|uniref:hypothetical protein n=1 Tax=Chroococcidiopsis sp. TS-821 TaxID=1378066 RepID=UPI00143D2638|nr:hypothetical protein [Chroococcidiopsis sp. TS-821]